MAAGFLKENRKLFYIDTGLTGDWISDKSIRYAMTD